MEQRKKNKVVVGFFVFLGFMWLCTVISKSIYASKLPIVSTESAEQKYVEHIVEVDGIVVAGDKDPVTVLSGLRVEKILVQPGDKVEEGDVLFTVDMEDLADIMEEKQTAVAKLQAQIDTILTNQELERQRKELELQRAREDYDALARQQDTLVGRAAEAYSQIEDEIDNKKEEAKKYRNEERMRRQEEEKKKAMEEGKEWNEEEHWDGVDDSEDGIQVDESLLDSLQDAAYAEADAKVQRENAMREAERKVEDSAAPENEDAALEVNRLELSDMQADLSRFQAIKDAGGQIKAKHAGLVTDVLISMGDRTTDSAVMLFADDSVPCQFKALITQEQKKYIGLNDEVSLELDGSSRAKDARISYLSESSSAPGSYEVYIDLPEETGVPGLSGVMTRAESGERHPACVTPMAVHKEGEGGGRAYVYVVKEREGILGMEYYAAQVNVRVLDENESWVAVEGALDGDSVIISSSTIEVKNGDVVRLAGE